LGVGDEIDRHQPTLIKYFKDNNIRIKKIACGRAHSMAISETNQLFAWGLGRDGRLGINYDTVSYNQPTPVELFAEDGIEYQNLPVVEVECGLDHTVALIPV